jgi:hypothetical protein
MAYPVTVKVEYPEKLSRLTTLFIVFMLIPHFVVLYFLQIASGVVLFIAWWAILFTGKFPRSLFDFEAYVFRWSTRVNGYGSLFTDRYPPFSGNE